MFRNVGRFLMAMIALSGAELLLYVVFSARQEERWNPEYPISGPLLVITMTILFTSLAFLTLLEIEYSLKRVMPLFLCAATLGYGILAPIGHILLIRQEKSAEVGVLAPSYSFLAVSMLCFAAWVWLRTRHLVR